MLGLLARFVFMANVPVARLDGYLLAGQVTSRWTALPLAFFLPPAREQSGMGASVAGKITAFSLVTGTVLTVAIVGAALRRQTFSVLLAAAATTALSGIYYRRRIGGITGDCLGATNQITEIVVYLTGIMI